MRRLGILLALVGVMAMAQVCVAGEERSAEEMSAPVRAVKQKFHERRHKLHEECKEKMRVLEREERTELQAAMKIAHEKHAEEMRAKHDEQKEMGNKHPKQTQETHKSE